MTCIVALVDENIVWMGADSAGVSGMSLTVRKDPKIYRVGEMLFGFTSSFRMGQLIGYKLELPVHEADISTERYMNTSFIDALRDTLKDGGYARTKDGAEEAGNFLVGYRGRIFNINSDYQVGENLVDYDSVGCGSDIALGSLFSTSSRGPEDRIRIALEAAEAFSGGVRKPFLIDSI